MHRSLLTSIIALATGVASLACGSDTARPPLSTLADTTSPDTAAGSDTATRADTSVHADSSATPDTSASADTSSALRDTADAGSGGETADTHAVADTSVLDDTAAAADTTGTGTDAAPDTDADTDADAEADVNTDAADGEDTSQGGIEPVGTNVLTNGSFESWSDGLPDGWLGEASNLFSGDVVEDDSAAHDGVRACQLINPSDGHKRFTSAPVALEAGHYTCLYWVRGAGELRNGRYDGGYSSYSSYLTVDSEDWQQVVYSFNVAAPIDAFELIFSVRRTGEERGHLHLDDVHCGRAAEACDGVSCEPWQRCDNSDATCRAAPGYCADGEDCLEWQSCQTEDHRCAIAPGRCEDTGDCEGATPVCETASHTCVAGDPCEGVVCEGWQVCDPGEGVCRLGDGACLTNADCQAGAPVCDITSHGCVAIDAPANVVPNGGFEIWEDYTLGGATTFRLPQAWYGLCGGCSPYFPETEIDANDVREYTTAPHGGTLACQLVEPSAPAQRFTTEPFAVTPGVDYACAYWVRGHGTYRHRVYCGAWGTNTEFAAIDSDEWQQVTFSLNPQISTCELIFYASLTDPDRDHLQLDDVVCSRRWAP